MEEERIVSSPFQLEIPAVDLYSIIRPSFVNHPLKTAIIEFSSGRQLTYSDVYVRSELIARQLHSLGLRHGDRLAIYSQNCVEFVLVLVASFRLAATIVTINHLSTADELRHYIQLTEPKFLITGGNIAENALKATLDTPSVETLLVIGKHQRMTSLVSEPDDPAADLLPAAPPPDITSSVVNPTEDIAVIQFSSGTTGLPKAVMLSHYNFASVELPLLGMPCYVPDGDVRIIYQPMSHTYGFGVTCGALHAALTMVILPRFSLHGYLTAVQQYQIAELSIVPPIAVMMSKSDLSLYDLSRVTTIVCASAPLGPHTEAELLANRALSNPSLRIAQVYGLTESSGIISYSHINSDTVRRVYKLRKPAKTPPGSCGLLFANTQAKIVDLVSGADLGPNEDGEILARGPQMMLGYMKNSSATEATIDRHGWLHTGDIGHYDNDGFFYIVDRNKELIKYKGFQVAPAELEALILSHPDVADVGVIGIPDSESGELPQAWIVKKTQSHDASEKQIADWVSGQVAPYKRLRGGVRFVNVIPRSVTGKILRRLMRSQMTEQNLKSYL